MASTRASKAVSNDKAVDLPSVKVEKLISSEEIKEENPENESQRTRRSTKAKFDDTSYKPRPKKKPKTLHCTICPKKKSFKSKVLLNRHLCQEHGTTKRQTIMCEICSAVLKSQAYFKRHMATRHPKTSKVFVCDNCGKSFTHKDYLRIHMDRHRVHQILTCNVCQKSYISKHTFRRHLRTVS
jgi:hypothetical protein